jgi:hypothetical protein
MTPEQIAAMTPAELRIEIARRLGWKDFSPVYGSDLWLGQPPDDWMMGTGLPDWTTDISAAWQLTQPVIDNETCFNVSHDAHKNMWICAIYGVGTDCYGYAGTAPLAISRAWLMWKAAQP